MQTVPEMNGMAPPQSDEEFIDEFFRLHNNFRRSYGSAPLRMAEDLCDLATQHANKLAAQKYLTYEESFPDLGENSTFFPSHFNAAQAIQFWQKESLRYKHSVGGWQVGTNYFTQMVWKSSQDLGLGRASMVHDRDATKNQMVVVALYRPAGNSNKHGQFARNVGTLLTSKTHEGTPVDQPSCDVNGDIGGNRNNVND